MSGDNGFPADEPITLINAFEVPAEQVGTFAEQWRARAEIMSRAPGFRDARLHQAISPNARFQFVTVAHWASRGAWEAAQASPEFRARIDALEAEVRVGANPALYRVVSGFDRPRDEPASGR